MDSWIKSAFLKIAALGSLVYLPVKGKPGTYLMQDDSNGKGTPRLRPPGGHFEAKQDNNAVACIIRELGEEFKLPEKEIRKKIKFLGFAPEKKYFGNSFFELSGHGLKPGIFQASNSKTEKIHLVECRLDNPNYTGPQPGELLTAEEKAQREAADPSLRDGGPKKASAQASNGLAILAEHIGKYASTGIKRHNAGNYSARHSRSDLKTASAGINAGAGKSGSPVSGDLPGSLGLQDAVSGLSDHTGNEQPVRKGQQALRTVKSADLKIDWAARLRRLRARRNPDGKPEPGLNDDDDEGSYKKHAHTTSSKIEETTAADTTPSVGPLRHAMELAGIRKFSALSAKDAIRGNGDSGAPVQGDGRIGADAGARAGIQLEEGAADQAGARPAGDSFSDHPTTGPAAIAFALNNLNLDKIEADAHDIVRRKLKTRRPDAVRRLGYVQGFRRTGLHPRDLMISRVPVIPPQFRPYSIAGDTFIPGDANELYRDLINVRDTHAQIEKNIGGDIARNNKLHLYDAVAAVYGHGDPTSIKTKSRGVSGFLQKLVGSSPKYSFLQRQMLSKNQDFVGRGTIGVDPELGLDQIAIPEDMAWKLYAPHVQRRLVRGGMTPGEAIRAIQERTSHAEKHLDSEMGERPVIYSRAPSWWRHNVIAGYPKRIPGDAVMINSFVGTGLAADHDGDAINIHLPALHASVDDAKNLLMPSRMLFSIKDRNKVVASPKHEAILGLHTAQAQAPTAQHVFHSEAEALKAIKSGRVKLRDEITIQPAV